LEEEWAEGAALGCSFPYRRERRLQLKHAFSKTIFPTLSPSLLARLIES